MYDIDDLRIRETTLALGLHLLEARLGENPNLYLDPISGPRPVCYASILALLLVPPKEIGTLFPKMFQDPLKHVITTSRSTSCRYLCP